MGMKAWFEGLRDKFLKKGSPPSPGDPPLPGDGTPEDPDPFPAPAVTAKAPEAPGGGLGPSFNDGGGRTGPGAIGPGERP